MRCIKISILILVATLPGCIGLGARESFVEFPDGRKFRVKCQSDGRVKLKNGDVDLEVDNRGPTGQVWAAGTAALGKVYETAKSAVTEGK
jgi:hypothetical protein